MLVQPYTQIIIFVDFNERNIILENSETEIGDIRRRTTEVLLEVECKYLDKKKNLEQLLEMKVFDILFSLILISIYFGSKTKLAYFCFR